MFPCNTHSFKALYRKDRPSCNQALDAEYKRYSLIGLQKIIRSTSTAVELHRSPPKPKDVKETETTADWPTLVLYPLIEDQLKKVRTEKTRFAFSLFGERDDDDVKNGKITSICCEKQE